MRKDALFIDDLSANLLDEIEPWPSQALRDPRTSSAIATTFQADKALEHVCLTQALDPVRAEAIHVALEEAKFTKHHHHAYKISIARIENQKPSALTEFMDWLKTEEAAEHHRALTGWPKPLRCVQVQASRMKVGDYFPPHIDTDEEGVSAVYAFTQNWEPSWGGDLYFPEEKIQVPVLFNGLFLFRPKGAAHGVRKLSPSARANSRYTVTAFYYEAPTRER